MRFIGAAIRLVILIVIAVFAYWLIIPIVPAPEAPGWAQINSNLPEAMQRFSCDRMLKSGAAAPVKGCESI